MSLNSQHIFFTNTYIYVQSLKMVPKTYDKLLLATVLRTQEEGKGVVTGGHQLNNALFLSK